MRFAFIVLVFMSMSGLSGCSSQQLYSAGQEWKKNECNRIIDAQERNRCMQGNQNSHDDYKRQTEEAR